MSAFNGCLQMEGKEPRRISGNGNEASSKFFVRLGSNVDTTLQLPIANTVTKGNITRWVKKVAKIQHSYISQVWAK